MQERLRYDGASSAPQLIDLQQLHIKLCRLRSIRKSFVFFWHRCLGQLAKHVFFVDFLAIVAWDNKQKCCFCCPSPASLGKKVGFELSFLLTLTLRQIWPSFVIDKVNSDSFTAETGCFGLMNDFVVFSRWFTLWWWQPDNSDNRIAASLAQINLV